MTDKFNKIMMKLVDENDKEQRRNLAIQLLSEVKRFLKEQSDKLQETT